MIQHKAQINEKHLARKAVVYVRQFKLHQVQEDWENFQQCQLYDFARQLGWNEAQIEINNEDVGRSMSANFGFETLVGQVMTGEVGAIFSVGLLRLARQDNGFFQLVEVAAEADTLLVVDGQIYDPRSADDLFVLRIKQPFPNNELHLIRKRSLKNRLNKVS